MSTDQGSDLRTAVLRHPFFLAGLAVVLLLGLTAGILVLFDSVSGSAGAGEPTVVVAPATTTTPGPVQRTAVASGVIGTTIRVTTVRIAPGSGSAVLGTLPSGTDIEIDGRTTDGNWFRCIFPPNSELHGWIDAEDLELTGDAESLVVATAEPAPIVALPTDSPAVLTAVAEQQTVIAEPETPTPSPTPGGQLPDLVVGGSSVLAGNKLFVTVVNQGTGDAAGDIVVAVFNADGTALVGGATLPNFSLPAGRSIDVATGYIVQGSQSLLLIVDPNGTLEESDNLNNRITVSIETGGPAPPPDPFAPTPTPAPPPPPFPEGVITPWRPARGGPPVAAVRTPRLQWATPPFFGRRARQDERMLTPVHELQSSLRESRERLFTSIRGLSEEQFRFTPHGDSWSVATHLAHLLRIERIYAERARAALTEEEPYVASTRAQNDDDPGLAQHLAVPQIIHGMLNTRRDLEAVLAGCDERALEQPIRHETLGRMTLEQIMLKMTGHEDEHAALIAACAKQTPPTARVTIPPGAAFMRIGLG